MSEIRWKNGQKEYSREEVMYMLETQRAMIYNDTKLLCIEQAKNLGMRGEITQHGKEIMRSINDCRKVVF